MRKMNNARFKSFDGPRQQRFHRVWSAEIEIHEHAPEGIEIERGRNGAFCYPLSSKRQPPSQEFVPMLAVGTPREQGRDAAAWLALMIFHSVLNNSRPSLA